MGALPSRISSPVNVAACRTTDILVCPSPASRAKSPGSRSIVVDTAATSGSSGIVRGGRGGPSPNAVRGCTNPKRRIQRSVALNETRTCHDPPSCSPIRQSWGVDDGGVGVVTVCEMKYAQSRSCRVRRRFRTRGGIPRRGPALASASCDTATTWQPLPHLPSRGYTPRTPRPLARSTRPESARANQTTKNNAHHSRSFVLCENRLMWGDSRS